MIRRTLDPTFLNSVANHPEVRPWIGGDRASELDFTIPLRDIRNIGIEADGGGWVLFQAAPGDYDLHTLFLKAGRGKSYFRAAREALRMVFSETDACEIMTKCPADNPGAHSAALLMGFRSRFEMTEAPGIPQGATFYTFTIDDWCARDAEGLRIGTEFRASAGLSENEAHARALGCTILMLRAGQPQKAAGFFNRWARFAGFAQIELLGQNLVRVQDAIVHVKPESIEVLISGE